MTVTNLASGFSRTYNGPTRIVSDPEMKFNVNSSVFLGGLPSNEKVRNPGCDMSLFVYLCVPLRALCSNKLPTGYAP